MTESHKTQILAISGKKQSGKNTCLNFILGAYMIDLGIIQPEEHTPDGKKLDSVGKFQITSKGELWVSNIDGDTDYAGVFDVFRQTQEMCNFKKERLDPYIKIYSFADMLKKNVCMDILGLTYEQCYGTDDDKNTETHLKWINMPGVAEIDAKDNFISDSTDNDNRYGYMTARSVMQYMGTEIFRAVYNNVWADATIRQIQKDNPVMAIICDCRFPNEVEAVHNTDGKVVRLTRDPFKDKDQDIHSSETMLDWDNYDWKKFDAIIENSDCTIAQNNRMVYEILAPWGLIPDIFNEGNKS